MESIKIFYKVKDNICKSFFKLQQFFLLKKYQRFDIPIKAHNRWYYKEQFNSNDYTYEIQTYSKSDTKQFSSYVHKDFLYRYSYGVFKGVSKSKISEFHDYIHAHDFYKVLEDVYNYPKSFFIKEEYKEDYSKQEIDFIKKLQEKCIEDGLGDIGYFTESSVLRNYVNQFYSISELRRRNIKRLQGVNIRSYLKKCKNGEYLTFDKDWKVIISIR